MRRICAVGRTIIQKFQCIVMSCFLSIKPLRLSEVFCKSISKGVVLKFKNFQPFLQGIVEARQYLFQNDMVW